MDEIFKEIALPIFFLFLGFIVILTIPVIILDYYSSCREAKIYNQQNETNYTCSDFFWASSQINKQTQTIKIDNN